MFGVPAKDALPPLLFAILKPLTPPGVEVSFYDENTESVPYADYDAVAISIDTFTARRGYSLASHFRNRGIPVILGGIHASFCPDEATRHADAVVVGEAEDTWSNIIADLISGELKPRYISGNSTELSTVRYDYSVFAGKRYNPVYIVQFSRGCRFSCDFCSIHALYGRTLRTRPAAAVAQTFREIPRRILFFADDNLFSDPSQIDELLTQLEPLKRRWVCQISMDAARSPELLCRLRKSGCVMVIMGFESLDEENLRLMNKGANLPAYYDLIIGNIREAGLMLYGTFVIGYDADTPDSALRLAEFAMSRGLAIANFNPLIPTPGTGLYSRLENEGRLLYERWWDDPDYRYGDTAFKPNSMSPEQLAESCRGARYGFYSLRGIFMRMRGVNAGGCYNTWLYLLMNLISRASIRHKQGRRLGA